MSTVLVIYLVIHGMIGLLSWGWYYYSGCKAWGIPHKNQDFVMKRKDFIIAGIILSTLFGFGTLLAVLIDGFRGTPPLKLGLKFW